jgi:hypothetical protein
MSQPPRSYRNRPFPNLNWVLLIVLVGLLGYLIVDRYRASAEPEYAEVIVAERDLDPTVEYVVEEPYDPSYGDRPVVDRSLVDDPVESYIVIPRGYSAADYDRTYNRYLEYTADMTGEMGLDHEFSHAALTYLANAVIALAWETGLEDRQNIQETVERIRYYADGLTVDPDATNHADLIRAAAMDITDLLRQIDQLAFGAEYVARVTDLRTEAAAIDPATLTLNQREDVRSFLRAARNALTAMQRAT